MADEEKDESVQGTEDDPLIELGEDKVKRSELIALRSKAANLDKDYTEKTTRLAKDKDELDKQFAAVKDLAKFARLIEEDPEEAERQIRHVLKRKGGKGKDDDDDDRGSRRRYDDEDDEREQRLRDIELELAIQELSKDPDFRDNEEEILKYAVDNNMDDPKLAFKAWKGENFDKLHESRLRAVKEKEKEKEAVLKGGPGTPSGDWKGYDMTKSMSENLQLMRQSKK